MKLGNKIILVLFLFFLSVSNIFAFNVPTYTSPIEDFAGVLQSSEKEQIQNTILKEAEKKDGVEIAVVILKDLQGESVEDVSQQFFDKWKIGKKDYDNGILFLISINDRKLRIHTGYGSEVFLNDATSGRIIRNEIAPLLKDGKYYQAISSGVNSIIQNSKKINQSEIKKTATGDIDVISAVKDTPFILIFFGVISSYLFAFLGRSKSWWPGGLIGGIIGFIFFQFNGLIILGIIGFILDYILSKNYKTWKIEHRTTSWRNTWGGFHQNKPDFKFGGGSSGGGGASGSW